MYCTQNFIDLLKENCKLFERLFRVFTSPTNIELVIHSFLTLHAYLKHSVKVSIVSLKLELFVISCFAMSDNTLLITCIVMEPKMKSIYRFLAAE